MPQIDDLLITDMTLDHLDIVHEIETRSFVTPWSKNELRREITENNHAIYKVAITRSGIDLAGYAGLWHIVNEGQITNIAVDKPYRHMGVGSLLLESLITVAKELEMIGLTLEVRKSNISAQGLYKKYGFISEGIRKNYYPAIRPETNREDAIIMWKYL